MSRRLTALLVGVLLAAIPQDLQVARAFAEDAPPPVRVMADLKEPLRSIDLNPDGTLAAVVTDKGKLRLWNVKESTELMSFESPEGEIARAAFSQDGKLLLVSLSNGELAVWDVVTKKPLWRRPAGDKPVVAVVSSVDGRMIAALKPDGGVLAWKAADGAVVFTTKPKDLTIGRGLAFSESGKHLTVVGLSPHETQPMVGNRINHFMQACVLDAQLGIETQRMRRFPTQGEVKLIGIRPSGDRFYSMDDFFNLTEWSIPGGYDSGGGGGKPVSAVADPTGHWVLQGMDDGAIRIIETDGKRECFRSPGRVGWLHRVAWSRDRRWGLSASAEGELMVWSIPSPLPDPYQLDQLVVPLVKQPTRLLKGHSKEIFCVKFLPGEPLQALSSSFDLTLRLWDVTTGETKRKVDGTKAWDMINDIAISSNGELAALACGQYAGTQKLRLFDLKKWQEVRQFAGHVNAVRCVDFAEDGTRLISGSLDQTVRVWDVKSGKELQKFGEAVDPKTNPQAFQNVSNYVWDVAFAPDGKSAVALGLGRKAIAWKTDKWTEHFVIPEERRGMPSKVTFAPDGKQFVLVSYSRLDLFETETGMLLNQVDLPGAAISASAISPDLKWLALADKNGTIRLFNVLQGVEQVRLAHERRQSVTSVSFSADSRWLLSAGPNHEIALWDLKSPAITQAQPERKENPENKP